MTYDEWKKARVEAAARELWTRVSQVEKALKAADAVPLPKIGLDDIELIALQAGAAECSKGRNGSAQVKAAIAALRPWLATMIEKGKGV